MSDEGRWRELAAQDEEIDRLKAALAAAERERDEARAVPEAVAFWCEGTSLDNMEVFEAAGDARQFEKETGARVFYVGAATWHPSTTDRERG
jgi:hypothetical protein